MTRANRSFWILAGTAIVAAGILAQALAAPASATADAIVIVSVVVLAITAILLFRVVRYLTGTAHVETKATVKPARRWQRRTSQ